MSTIEAIKAKVDVVDEIGLVVALQKSGKAFKGLCPFHNERTPSFYVFADSQTWHCFGCHEGGDVFTFVQKQQNLEFRDALLYLAEKAGVSVEEFAGGDPEQERETQAIKERMRKMNEDAQLWFHQMLLRSKEAAEAREYVKSRGIAPDTVVAFGLGYAPQGQSWDGLTRYLLSKSYTERELIHGGLAREREESKGGGIYDYFRQRLIFPIRDTRGRVIGFGGRELGGGQPKYLNSPQTLLFEKNSVLYALDMARDAIKEAKQVVIVEGYVDAVIAHQYGTKQTVACIGSAITEKHIQQLKKLTKQVTLALDPDAAGESATEHGIQEVLKSFDRTVVPVPLAGTPGGNGGNGKRGRNEPRGIIRMKEQVDAEINVLRLPPGEDPDEVMRRDLSLWQNAVAHPLPLIDYYFETKLAGLNLREPTGQVEASKRMLPVIGMISDRVKRDAYIRKLAALINIDERSLYDELQRNLRGQRSTGVVAQFSEKYEPGKRAAKGAGEREGKPEWVGDGSFDGDGGSDDNPGTGDGVDGGQRATGAVGGGRAQQKRSAGGLDKRKANALQWEDYLIGLLLQNPGLSTHVCGIITDGDFAGTDTRELYRILNSMSQRGFSSLNQPVEQVVPSTLLATVERVRKCAESSASKDEAGLVRDAVQCATRLKRTRLVQLNIELQYLMREAETTDDATSKRQLRLQLFANQQQLRTIDSATHLQG